MDNSPNSPNQSGNNRNSRGPFRLGRGSRRNPPQPLLNEPLGSSATNFLIPNGIALGINPPPSIQAYTSPLAPLTSAVTTAPPIHARPMVVNPQSASPLYNGAIPPEIRDHIFQYSMSEYTKEDAESKYPESTDYTRPGYTGCRAVAISLLLTCRRVYLETYHLPARNKEHVFWHGRGPAHQKRYASVPGGEEQVYFGRLKSWQLELVKEIHLFTQLFWLERESFFRLTEEDFMQGIEKVKVTIRRGDWWFNERNTPLGISPQRSDGNAVHMQRDWEAEKRGLAIPWRAGGWGCAFGNLKGLKELEMEFETTEDKVVELGKIVENARTWKFPLNDGKVLSTEGLEGKTWKWRGPLCLWCERCPYCRGRAICKGTEVPCMEKKLLINMGLGPECTVMSLRWRVVNGTV